MTEHPKKSVGEDLKEQALSAVDTATDMAHRKAEDVTEAVTNEAESRVSDATHAAHAAGDEFEAGSLQAQAADQVAAGLQQVASSLRATDFDKAAGTVTRFARENPALFVGGAALLGFAAARFLKASEPNTPRAPEVAEDVWTGHVTATDVRAPMSAPPAGEDKPHYTNGGVRS